MAIAYIYYNNSMDSISVYLWEPNTETVKYKLFPYNNSKDVFACKDVLINFTKNTCTIRRDNSTYSSPLREPTKDNEYLKHQAHFDFDPGDWGEFAEAF